MWNEGDPRRELRGHEVAMGRSGSEVVVLDDRIIEAANRAQPGVTNINVTKSSRLHIGPKFVSVTQNVDNTEVVKGEPLSHYVNKAIPSVLFANRCVHIHILRYLHISELAHVHVIYIDTSLLW